MKKLYKNRLFFLFTRLKTHRDQRRSLIASIERRRENEKNIIIIIITIRLFV